MFLLNNNPLGIGTPFEHEGVQYPANWLQLATLEEKEAIGIIEVPDPVRADDRFYWNGDSTLPKELEDSTDPESSITIRGLKSVWSTNIKTIAYTILQPTDYIEIRNIRDSAYKPEVIVWRESVRTKAAEVISQIVNVTSVEDLISVVSGVEWPSLLV